MKKLKLYMFYALFFVLFLPSVSLALGYEVCVLNLKALPFGPIVKDISASINSPDIDGKACKSNASIRGPVEFYIFGEVANSSSHMNIQIFAKDIFNKTMGNCSAVPNNGVFSCSFVVNDQSTVLKITYIASVQGSPIVRIPPYVNVQRTPVQSKFRGNVIKVVDGDSVDINYNRETFTCRLYGIDAPEASQPFGQEAATQLRSLILNQTVEVILIGEVDLYERQLCIIGKNNTTINIEMVRQGYAWAYRQYLRDPYTSKFIDAEQMARKMRLGLWQNDNSTPPWEWRHKQN